eukprot:TRINITY_DN2612_c0_g1_i2.p1 TRINITY_DN2612_c0_g1~~TRINITY_DN2612_c0_g1_i2.p1  ORF type:complete len:422 (+),score=98.74 TRINITY_DN2612_c0_g1_i2:150-1268(+)
MASSDVSERQGLDFRSDTITHPPPEMRRAMAEAEVGDDVYGEDPTVNALEARCASLFGKQAALFVPTGTMGNLLGVLAHCEGRGQEFITGNMSHIFLNEQGGSAWIGGVHARPVATDPAGTLPLQAIKDALRNAGDIHHPITRLITLENTHNFAGGRVIPTSYTRSVAALVQEVRATSTYYEGNPIRIHVDGARIFNASVALGEPVAHMCEPVDSVQFCFSKGLCAPVGSVVVGSESFVASARRMRKALGGGMRQAGVLAAAGMYALDNMVERLADDHANAKELATRLSNLKEVEMFLPIETNIVIGQIVPALFEKGVTAYKMRDVLKARGVLISPLDARRFRLVTHYHVTPKHIQKAADIITDIFEKELKV